MKVLTGILFALWAFTGFHYTEKETPGSSDIQQLWVDCKLKDQIPFELFRKVMLGCQHVGSIKNKSVITIIDFSKPSSENRFFVIDIENKRLLYKCLVAHGRNSGESYAEYFSDEEGSLKSCLGFFLTAETYYGKHGYSLRLDGMESGLNGNARMREIVIHGADYVSKDYIQKYGRLGRSWGCPALPPEMSKEIIDRIANGSCLFIYANDNYYKEKTTFLY